MGGLNEIFLFTVPAHIQVYLYTNFSQQVDIRSGYRILQKLTNKDKVLPNSVFYPGEECPDIMLSYHNGGQISEQMATGRITITRNKFTVNREHQEAIAPGMGQKMLFSKMVERIEEERNAMELQTSYRIHIISCLKFSDQEEFDDSPIMNDGFDSGFDDDDGDDDDEEDDDNY